MIQFDARNVNPVTNGLPLGEYDLQLIEGEIKQSETNDGSWYLRLTAVVLSGQYQGQKISENLNLGNRGQNAATVIDLAQKKLSAYCHVTGRFTVNSPNASELFGVPFKAKCGPQKNDDRYSEIKELKDASGRTIAEIMKGAPPANNSAPAANGWGNQPTQQPQQMQQPQQNPNAGWGQPPQGQQQPQANPAQGWNGQQQQPPTMGQQYPVGGQQQQPAQGGAAQGWQQPAQQQQPAPGAWNGQQPSQQPQQPPQGQQQQPAWGQPPQGQQQQQPAWGNPQ